jgi:hypothetical protein
MLFSFLFADSADFASVSDSCPAFPLSSDWILADFITDICKSKIFVQYR